MRRSPSVVSPALILVLSASALPAQEARKGNRLADETSPYLLQHAHNPVDWYPWGPEAFERARKEGKPIFLSVGYSSCYWCHVMERECFESEAIAQKLNERFICIKVDREERPDVDQVYMTALQAMTGHGGWPMSMFLTPDGRPFYGGTYMPPVPKDGMPGFPTVLDGVADAWRDEREQVERAASQMADLLQRSSRSAAARQSVPLTPDMLIAGQQALAEQFDPDFGGFGFDPDNPRRPKFPEPSNLVFLLDRHRRTPENPVARRIEAADPRLKGSSPLAMVLTTLDHMARGGIHDHLGGGYHRYSVNRSWTVPHFEKMLYDNAQLARVFLEAFEITGDPRWRREAEDIFTFVARDLTDPKGGFYSTLDAETNGEEGAYYVWTPEDVRQVLGPDADLFIRVYGLDRTPNFEGERFVLNRLREPKLEAETFEMDAGTLETRLQPSREKLREARSRRVPPRLDDKILTAWTGLMIAAYADGYRVLKDERYRLAAEKAADFLLTTLRAPDGRLLRTYRAGKAKLPAYLEDYAFLALGLYRLHVATGDPRRLEQARELVDRMRRDFADDQHGGYFFTADGHESLLARMKDPYDNALPSGNSVAIGILLDLAESTGDASYRDEAGKALRAFSFSLEQVPAGMPWMLVGLARFLEREPAQPAPAALPLDDPLGVSSKDVISAKGAVMADSRPVPGGRIGIQIALTIKPGWHIYANPSGSEAVRPTVVAVAKDAPVSDVEIRYPEGTPMRAADGGDPVSVYEGEALVRVQAVLSDRVKPGKVVVPVEVRYQACNDRACLAPATLKVPVTIDIPAR
jgi:uncharacterized protein YyaL (SSP411 family)